LLARAGWPVDADVRLLMHQGCFAGVRCGSALLRALATLPAHFLLVFTGMVEGTPALEELRTLAANLGVAGRIIVLDRLPFAELQRFTAACDAGILLYPNDGVGNYYQAPGRLTQYLACGLPVLASDFPGLELLILKHELGVVCNPACPTSIARGVSVLLEGSAEQRQCRATRLRTTVMTELCYDRFAGQIEQAVHRASTGW
jgi:glycosyltransferase involved in cell wall biosynthesis